MIVAFRNSPSRVFQALGLHALAVLVALAAGVATALLVPPESWGLLAASGATGAILLLLVTGFILRRTLRPAEVIERLLASLADGGDDPFEFPQLAVASPAAVGWNRLAKLGQRWSAFHQLEQNVAAGLARDGGGAAGAVLDALADGLAATDEAGRIVQANAAFLAMCGAADPGDFEGRATVDLLRLSSECIALIADAPPRKRISFDHSAPAGEAARTLRITRSPRYDERQELCGHVWVLRDVTQQRLADDMRDRFLAAATHELRTPLANIRAYAETLATMDGIDAESQKQFYNIIQSEAVRLSQLIDDLLDVSRMQAGALAIDRRETDLARLVEEVSQKVEGTMRSRQIDFRCELPPKYPKILADKSKLAAAVVNLLGNAAKYTPEGGRVTFRVDVAVSKVEFSVADTGIGIAPEELPRVFDRFFRSDDDRVRDIPGSGLGLALTQEIARLHGGDLAVDSELNVGSVFRMTIPLDSGD